MRRSNSEIAQMESEGDAPRAATTWQTDQMVALIEKTDIDLDGGISLKLDLDCLRLAIKSGDVNGVEIVEHEELIEAIENSELKPFPKRMAKAFSEKDREIVIKGVIPARFLQVMERE